MGYKDDLRTRSWQKRAAEIKAKRGWKCEICHTDKDIPLEVHHLAYHEGFKPWQSPDSELLVVCDRCHEYEHFKDFAAPLIQRARELELWRASLPTHIEEPSPGEIWVLRAFVVTHTWKIWDKLNAEWILHPIIRLLLGKIKQEEAPTVEGNLSNGLRMLRDRWIDRELKSLNNRLAEPLDDSAFIQIDKQKTELRRLKTEPI